MSRSLIDPAGRMLNHVELFYGPGDRQLTQRFFEALGCRVLDPKIGPRPANLGPAADPYLMIHPDPGSEDLIDNILYASEVAPAQWRFEELLRDAMAHNPDLAASRQQLRDSYPSLPQAMTHIGIAFPDGDAVERTLDQIAAASEFAGRVRCSPVFRPGGPGSVDDRVVQGFVHTDICSTGLLTIGQLFELQARLDP